jgi:hypothetical protein
MAVGTAKPLHRGRQLDVDEKGVREYERPYLVVTTSALHGPWDVIQAPGLPALYTPYPDDPLALRVGLSPRGSGDESGLVWEVIAKYSTKYDSPQNNQSDPLERPIRFSGGLAYFKVPAVKDNEGNPILNLAGDPYDPPAEADDARLTLVAVRNERTIPWETMRQYKNAVNSDQFNGCPPRTVKVRRIEPGEPQTENGRQFYSVRYEFEHDERTWDIELLEIGYNGLKWTNDTPKKVPFSGDKPRLLKSTGLRNAHQNVNFTDNPEEASYTKWKYYPERSFGTLGLEIPEGQ